MSEFGHTTAKIAAWNLAGFNAISDEKLEKQIEGPSDSGCRDRDTRRG